MVKILKVCLIALLIIVLNLALAGVATGLIYQWMDEHYKKTEWKGWNEDRLHFWTDQKIKTFMEQQYKQQVALSCLQWGSFNEEEKNTVMIALKKINPEMNVEASKMQKEAKAGGWIEWGGLASEAMAKQKILETKMAGLPMPQIVKSKQGWGLKWGPWNDQQADQLDRYWGIIQKKNIRFMKLRKEAAPVEYQVKFGPWPSDQKEILNHLEKDMQGTKIEPCMKNE